MNIEQSVLFRSGLDLGRLVSDAEASGFNPLTVLRAGGAGAYLVTEQHVGTPKAPAPKPVTAGAQNAAALFQGGHGSGFLGQGRSSGSAALRNMRERKAKREERRERRERKAAVSRPSVPASGAGGFGAAGPGAAYGGVAAVTGGLGLSSRDRWTEEVPGVTNPMGFDWWYSHPDWADIETGAEARYGDIGGAFFFPLTLGADIGYTAAKAVENATGWSPRDIGPAIRQGVSDFVQGVNWSDLWSGDPSGNAPPLSITVGGPNQTGL